MDESLGQNAGRRKSGSGLGQVTVLGSSLFDLSTAIGQDKAGATTAFSLNVTGGGVSGLSSTDGQPITLVDNGAGTILGLYGAGILAFTVTIDASTGNITLTQFELLRHPTGGLASPDEAVSLATGALQAVLTVTDGDGDIATSTADLGGIIGFEDDGPTQNAGATPVTAGVEEDGMSVRRATARTATSRAAIPTPTTRRPAVPARCRACSMRAPTSR